MFAAIRAVFRKSRATDIRPAPEILPLKINTQIFQPKTAGDEVQNAPQTIGDVFPQVRHVAVNLVIRAPHNEIEPTMNGRSFGPGALAFFKFRCKNVECIDGDFDLTDVIELAIAQRKPEVTGRLVCKGWDGKSNVGQVRCHYELNYKIHIGYR